MSDEEIDQMVVEIDNMARRINCRFIPDALKLDAFRALQRQKREWVKEYETTLRS